MSLAGSCGKQEPYLITTAEALAFGFVPQKGGYQELSMKKHDNMQAEHTLLDSQKQLPMIWETKKKNAQDYKCS